MSGKKANVRKNKQTEGTFRTIGNFFAGILTVLSSVCAILILVVMPFYFQEGYTHIGTDKSYFFRTGTVRLGKLILPVLGIWLLCRAADLFLHRPKDGFRTWADKICATDIFAFFYGLSVILSYFGSNYKGTALWGTKGWFMGLIPQLALVAIYFLLRCFQAWTEWILLICLPVSAVVFILGYLNRFDVWPLSMERSGLPLYISTIGNINWYCGYVVSVLFVGAGLLWLDRGEKLWRTLLLCGYVFTGFATLITQGSDSGVFVLGVILLTLFVLSAKAGDAVQIGRFWLIVLLLGAAGLFTLVVRLQFPGRITFTSGFMNLMTYSPLPALLFLLAAAGVWLAGKCDSLPHDFLRRGMRIISKAACIVVPFAAVLIISMIALNTLRPGSLGSLSDKRFFTFNLRWGSSRGATWTIGLRCFAEQDFLHKLTGAGPDCMADFLYSGSSPALLETVQKAFENRRLTNAHCELLTILVNTGLLGAFSYAGMFLCVMKRLLSAGKKNPYAMICGICVLAYFANSLWSFQQSLGVATIFVIMGLGERFLHQGTQTSLFTRESTRDASGG